MAFRGLRYEIAGLPIGPTLNDRGWALTGWKAREQNRQARDAMREVINRTPRPSLYPLEGPLEMEVRFYLGTRGRRDARQLMVQCKPYEDELVAAGIIADDGWKVIPRHVCNIFYRKGWPGFDIILRPLSPLESSIHRSILK